MMTVLYRKIDYIHKFSMPNIVTESFAYTEAAS